MSGEENPDWENYGLDQMEVEKWVRTRFGDEVMDDLAERVTRVGEEGIELMQAGKVPEEVVHALVKRVYSRKPGDMKQEAAGVIVTLIALCALKSWRLDRLAQDEIKRIHQLQPEHFHAKQTEKAKAGVAKAPAPPKDEPTIIE